MEECKRGWRPGSPDCIAPQAPWAQWPGSAQPLLRWAELSGLSGTGPYKAAVQPPTCRNDAFWRIHLLPGSCGSHGYLHGAGLPTVRLSRDVPSASMCRNTGREGNHQPGLHPATAGECLSLLTQGESERYVGRWLRERNVARDKVMLSTKIAGPSGQMTWIRGGPHKVRTCTWCPGLTQLHLLLTHLHVAGEHCMDVGAICVWNTTSSAEGRHPTRVHAPAHAPRTAPLIIAPPGGCGQHQRGH